MHGVGVTILAKTNAEGNLYKAISIKDVVETLKKEHYIVIKEELVSMEPIKRIGEYIAVVTALGLTEEVRKTINVLKLDSVGATNENIAAGKYPIWAYEHMYTKGEAKDLTKAFLDYMVSDAVKPIIKKLGYIQVSDMKVSR